MVELRGTLSPNTVSLRLASCTTSPGAGLVPRALEGRATDDSSTALVLLLVPEGSQLRELEVLAAPRVELDLRRGRRAPAGEVTRRPARFLHLGDAVTLPRLGRACLAALEVLVDLLQQPTLPLHHRGHCVVHDGEVAPSLHQLQKLLLEGGQRVDQIPVVLLPHEVVAPGLEEPARVLEPELELPGQPTSLQEPPQLLDDVSMPEELLL